MRGGKVHEHQVSSEMCEKRAKLRREAVSLAKQYADVIFIGGLNHEQDSEGNDRRDMKLPYEQDLLLKELLKVNPRTVIVLTGGSPVEMGEWIQSAEAVVWNWYAGTEGGRALAEVIFGEVNPSGKLPETFYKKHTDCSAHCLGEFPGKKNVRYSEGVFLGYRYNDSFHISPQFCFGHGLSYTSFEYRTPELIQEEGERYVCCTVVNAGEVEGKETIQIYLAPLERKAEEPVQQLKGFEKVTLRPGEEDKDPVRRKYRRNGDKDRKLIKRHQADHQTIKKIRKNRKAAPRRGNPESLFRGLLSFDVQRDQLTDLRTALSWKRK